MDEKIKISLIGSGNVATVFGKLLRQNNFIINQVISRNIKHAAQLANELNADVADNFDNLSTSDVYIISVTDNDVEKISDALKINDKIVLHTAGSISINILQNTSENFGVLYPLQSLRKELVYKNNIPLLIDSSNYYTKKIIQQIATAISNNVKEANDEERLKYHLSAVIVSNFSNHLFALTKQYCEINNIDFLMLFPLIEETVNRLHTSNPAETQTGPAFRRDTLTIEKHIQLLNEFPQLQKIYKLMSDSIFNFNYKKV